MLDPEEVATDPLKDELEGDAERLKEVKERVPVEEEEVVLLVMF